MTLGLYDSFMAGATSLWAICPWPKSSFWMMNFRSMAWATACRTLRLLKGGLSLRKKSRCIDETS